MARTLTRSGGSIIPDVMRLRRFNPLYSVDRPTLEVPVSARFPLASVRDTPGIFSQVGPIRVEGADQGYEQPTLVWDRPIHSSRPGSSRMRPAIRTVFFAAPAKMPCPSWSIPAGPPEQGGTCIASLAKFPGRDARKIKAGQPYVCDICYALEKNYWMPDVAFSHAARLAWMLQHLDADPTGTSLAVAFVRALSEYATRSVGGSDRVFRECGTWDSVGRQVVVPLLWLDRTGTKVHRGPAVPAWLPEWTGHGSSSSAVAALGPKQDEVAGYVRIHDSGDFTIGSPAQNRAYLSAWTEVAKAFPAVYFWAPTRMNSVPGYGEDLAKATSAAPNLILRPSALHQGEAPPKVSGCAAGSTVLPKGEARQGAWSCPASTERWDPTAHAQNATGLEEGKKGAWVEARNCTEGQCRACWIAPGLPVSYGAH